MNGFEIIQTIIGTGLVGGVVLLIFRGGKVMQKISNIETKVTSIESDVKEIRTEIKHLSERVSHLEGGFEERGRNELIKLVQKQ